MKKLFALVTVLSLFSGGVALGESTPTPMRVDQRIKLVQYSPNDVVVIEAFEFVATMVQLSADETLDSQYPFLLGDPRAWDIAPFGRNAFYVKPIADHPNTNLTVRTDKRTYFFALTGSRLAANESIDSTRSNFAVIFQYPELKRQAFLEEQLAGAEEKERQDLDTVALDSTALTVGDLDFDYKVRGDSEIKPDQVFSAGGKTFFQFPGQIPAIFSVDGGKPTLVNYRVDGPYLVVDRESDRFELMLAKHKVKVQRF